MNSNTATFKIPPKTRIFSKGGKVRFVRRGLDELLNPKASFEPIMKIERERWRRLEEETRKAKEELEQQVIDNDVDDDDDDDDDRDGDCGNNEKENENEEKENSSAVDNLADELDVKLDLNKKIESEAVSKVELTLDSLIRLIDGGDKELEAMDAVLENFKQVLFIPTDRQRIVTFIYLGTLRRLEMRLLPRSMRAMVVAAVAGPKAPLS